MGWEVRGQSQIVPVVVGESGRALALAEELRRRGHLVTAVRPPTVPEGSARLRLSLCAAHAPQELDAVAEVLRGLR